jgi:hypothetical protein
MGEEGRVVVGDQGRQLWMTFVVNNEPVEHKVIKYTEVFCNELKNYFLK